MYVYCINSISGKCWESISTSLCFYFKLISSICYDVFSSLESTLIWRILIYSILMYANNVNSILFSSILFSTLLFYSLLSNSSLISSLVCTLLFSFILFSPLLCHTLLFPFILVSSLLFYTLLSSSLFCCHSSRKQCRNLEVTWFPLSFDSFFLFLGHSSNRESSEVDLPSVYGVSVNRRRQNVLDALTYVPSSWSHVDM